MPGAYAIGSAGYIPGTGYQFPGSNLQGPVSIDGIQYGLTSLGDNPLTGNTPVTGTNALIQNSVLFTFAYSGDLDLRRISGVSFQYGTSLTEPNVPGGEVPEVATSLMIGSGLYGMWWIGRRKQRRLALQDAA
jgi:hypothetical protein